MIALLSPAKNLNFDSSNGLKTSMPIYLEESDHLVNKLKKLSARQIGKLMSINPELSQLNYDRYQTWNSTYEDVESKASLLAFNGEVYRGLSAADFSKEDLSFADEHLIILSGLHGILRPLDRIQPYRLEMGTKLNLGKRNPNLYAFWKEKIAAALNDRLESQEQKVILNLASNEYFKAVNTKALNGEVIQFQFLDWKNGAFKSVMTWAKLARGKMAREIVKNRIDHPEQLPEISFDGYHYNAAMSSGSDMVYTREER